MQTIILCSLLITSCSPLVKGLQCPSCTYLTSDADIHVAVRTIIDGILNLFQDPECAQQLKGPSSKIKEETCEVMTGQVERCSFYKGSVTITIPLIITSFDVPLQLYQRGCYHSKPANVPSNGCHNRANINEDKTVIKQILDKASSTFESYNLAKFTGEMCLCKDTDCKDTSKPANVPSNGYHNRDNINEDKTVIKQILDKDTSDAIQVTSFNTLLLLFSTCIYHLLA